MRIKVYGAKREVKGEVERDDCIVAAKSIVFFCFRFHFFF